MIRYSSWLSVSEDTVQACPFVATCASVVSHVKIICVQVFLCTGLFNLGSVLGLALTPALASVMSWPTAFALLGMISTVVAIQAFVYLQKTLNPPAACASPLSAVYTSPLDDRNHGRKLRPVIYKLSSQVKGGSAVEIRSPMQSLSQEVDFPQEPVPATRRFAGMAWSEIRDYAALIYHHSAIGWGFFLFQNWIPTYLHSLNVNDPILRGLLSALPWLPCVGLALVFGALFQKLRQGGMSHFQSQTMAHTIASIGAAIALLPVACLETVEPWVGLLCIGGALSLQTCNYSGFHAYVQTTYPDRAGRLLAVTNCCGIVAGLIANIAMGWMVDVTGSFRVMFAATAAIYFSSWGVWLACLRENPRVLRAVVV